MKQGVWRGWLNRGLTEYHIQDFCHGKKAQQNQHVLEGNGKIGKPETLEVQQDSSACIVKKISQRSDKKESSAKY